MAITLNANAIYSALSNQIISQQVYSNNIQALSEGIVDLNRVDGTLYGDTKLYYDTDILEVSKWGSDAEAANLLSLDRPSAPKEQKIVMNVFKQIRLTLDNYLTKQAWMSEGAFADFNAVLMSWLSQTKRVYDRTIHNAYVGTAKTSSTINTISVNLDSSASGDPLYGLTGEEKQRVKASIIAHDIAQTIKKMASTIYARKFVENGTFHTFDASNLIILWNNDYVDEIEKRDLPTMFHNDKLFENFNKHYMDSQFFGIKITTTNLSTYSASTPTTGKPIDSDDGAYTPISGKPIDSDDGAYTPGTNNANGKVCATQPMYFSNAGAFRTSGKREASTDVYVMAGEELPSGAVIIATNLAYEDFGVYIVDPSIICKITVQGSVPMMSSFEVGSEFVNPRSHTVNHYLTYGHNKLEYLKHLPLIEVKVK